MKQKKKREKTDYSCVYLILAAVDTVSCRVCGTVFGD